MNANTPFISVADHNQSKNGMINMGRLKKKHTEVFRAIEKFGINELMKIKKLFPNASFLFHINIKP